MSNAVSTKAKVQAEIYYAKQGNNPAVEIVVPAGTKLEQVANAHELISREAIAKISPRGCPQCISGAHVSIREKLEEVVKVDLPQVGQR